MSWSIANWLVATTVLTAHAVLGLLAARLKRWPGIVTAVILVLGISSFLIIGLEHHLPKSIASHCVQVAYTWVNVLEFFIGFLCFFYAEARFWGRLTGVLPIPVQWRSSFVLALISTAFVTVYAVSAATRAPQIKAIRIEVEDLSIPVRIVQLSDLHLGMWGRGRAELEQVVMQVEDLQPDIVVITGDTIDDTVDQLAYEVQPLRGLAERFPTYMVLGNHEDLWGQDAWAAEFTRLGIRVLRNEALWLHEPCLWLVGVDDVDSSTYNPALAFDEVDPSAPAVLLSHQPQAVHDAAGYGADLVLAGDTHGGQVWPQGWMLAWMKQGGYVSGFYHEGDTTLYVSDGTGWSTAPLRLGTTSEITLITLTPSN